MFTDYHLEKLIQAINDAEERQTKAIVAAIEKMIKHFGADIECDKRVKVTIDEELRPKPKPIFKSTPKGGFDMLECPDVLGEDDAVKHMKESFYKAREQKKTSATKKPNATKKPAPVRSRS